MALTLPILASMITGPLVICVFRLEMNGAPISSGMGTCGLVSDVAFGVKAAVTSFDWIGLILICFILPL